MLKKKAHSQQWRCIQLENPDFRLNSLCSNPGFISTSLVTWGQLPNCWYLISSPVCCYSVTQSCPTLCDPMDCSTAGLPVHHQLPESTQTHVHWVGDAIQPSHSSCRPLLLLPSIFPSIKVFSNESPLRIRWSKYWSFGFSISPSNENSWLISFRVDWFDLLALQGVLSRVFSSTTVQKHQFLSA